MAPDVIATDLSMWGPIVVLMGDRAAIPVALSSTFMGPLIPGPDAPAAGLRAAGRRGRRAARAPRRARRAPPSSPATPAAPARRRAARRARPGADGLTRSTRYTAGCRCTSSAACAELDYDRADLPPSVHYVGDCIWHPPTPAGDARVARRHAARDRPWVHVTESTIHVRRPVPAAGRVEGLRGAPVEAIVTHGRRARPRGAGPRPAAGNVHVTRWVSHGALLPRCAAS